MIFVSIAINSPIVMSFEIFAILSSSFKCVYTRRSDFDGYFDYSVPPGGMQEQIHKIIECL